MPPSSGKVQKYYFQHKGQDQGHKVIDIGVIWKGFLVEYACQII